MKIPKDVSTIQRKLAEAAARLKRAPITNPNPKEPQQPNNPNSKDPRVQRANQQAAEERQKARKAMQTNAEYEARLTELQDALTVAEKRAADAEPSADRWNKYAHREKEILVAKFPKEDQARVRKMDVDDLKFLAQRLNITAASGNGDAPNPKGATATKITSVQEAAKLGETDPKAFNKFMDDVTAGAIKVDADGRVLA